MNISLSAFAPENLVSRDGFGSPVPRHPAHLHTQAESGAYFRDSSRVPRRCPFIYLNRHTPSGQSREFIGSRNCVPMAFTAESPPGTRTVNLKVIMDQQLLIYASLSHTHYWYEVGMLRVPAISKNDCTKGQTRRRKHTYIHT